VNGSERTLRVVATGVEQHVIAAVPFEEGARILRIEGDLSERPNRYSLQVDDGLHVVLPAGSAPDDGIVRERYPWRFLNHSCAPNAAVRGRDLVAIRPVRLGDEVTFDYNTTEYEMASPFVCRCGACAGRTIGGFRHLTTEEQRRLWPHLPAYLRRHLEDRP
jgi:hypothetical protein